MQLRSPPPRRPTPGVPAAGGDPGGGQAAAAEGGGAVPGEGLGRRGSGHALATAAGMALGYLGGLPKGAGVDPLHGNVPVRMLAPFSVRCVIRCPYKE